MRIIKNSTTASSTQKQSRKLVHNKWSLAGICELLVLFPGKVPSACILCAEKQANPIKFL